jgi:four helix bundle protein
MGKGDDIQDRLINLAVSVTQICSSLAKNPPSTHISNQLIRCGTSPAANYAEARSGESRKDFIHKLGVVLKELNECLVWLQLLRRLGYVGKETIDPVHDECAELCRIIAASIKTASGTRKNS